MIPLVELPITEREMDVAEQAFRAALVMICLTVRETSHGIDEVRRAIDSDPELREQLRRILEGRPPA